MKIVVTIVDNPKNHYISPSWSSGDPKNHYIGSSCRGLWSWFVTVWNFFFCKKKKNPYIFKITAVEIFSKSHFFSILQHYNVAAHRETINKSRYVTTMAIIFIHGQANQKVTTNIDKFVSIILDSSILQPSIRFRLHAYDNAIYAMEGQSWPTFYLSRKSSRTFNPQITSFSSS